MKPAALAVVILCTACSERARVETLVDGLLEGALDEDAIAGATVGVDWHGLRVVRGAGFADREARTPAGPRTVYRIGSITKHMTAAAILQQVEAGALRLDGDVQDYLPRFPRHGITVEDLLTHTSGLVNYTTLDAPPVSRDGAAMLALFERLPLRFPPGHGFEYSNSGYQLLGEILETVTHQRYDQYLQSRLFVSLPRAEIFFGDGEVGAIAPGYRPRFPGFTRAPPPLRYGSGADGGVCATAGALLDWWRLVAGGSVISPASFARMQQPTRLAGGGVSPYGFGLWLGEGVGHSGECNYSRSRLSSFAADGLTIVVLTNSLSGVADGLAARLADELRRPRWWHVAILWCWLHDVALALAISISVAAGLCRLRRRRARRAAAARARSFA